MYLKQFIFQTGDLFNMEKKFKSIKNQKGVALVEMLMYIALFAVIITATIVIILDLFQIQQKIVFVGSNDNDARIALDSITRTIEEGYVTLTPSAASPSSNVLTVQTDSTGDTTTYFIQNGFLYLQINSNPATPLTSTNTNVSSLVFTRESNAGIVPTIFIQLTFATPVNIDNTTTTLQTVATQRRISN